MCFWNKFCGFIAIFFLSVLFCTAQEVKYPLSILTVKPALPATGLFLTTSKSQDVIALPMNLINSNYYAQHLGFICKKELALEKITKIPLRIRLGSLQQCNYLEGKK